MAFLGEEETTHDDGAGSGDTDTGTDGEGTTDDEEDTSQNSDSEDGEGESSSDDGEDDDGKGDSTKGSDTSKDDDTEEDDDDGAEPESRRPKTNAEWAKRRIERKNAKQSQKAEKGDDEGDEEDSEDGDDLSPEDARAIDKRIEKAIKPFQERALASEVDGEITEFLNANPDFKPFAKKVQRFAMHPSRQNIPIKAIFYEVAGDKLIKIGADRLRNADKKARETKTGGTGTSEKGSTSYKDMPLEDFGKELERVKTR